MGVKNGIFFYLLQKLKVLSFHGILTHIAKHHLLDVHALCVCVKLTEVPDQW